MAVSEADIRHRFAVQWERYASGEYRAPVFADVVLLELQSLGEGASVLDIGCGGGFDGDVGLQARIGAAAGRFIGVEPADDITPDACFAEIHRCTLEQAPIMAGSIDLAYAVMVVEHVSDPRGFVDSVARVLRRGGVFWAFTVDARYWTAWASALLDRARLKAPYMNVLLGSRGVERWQNYPVEYKLNTPARVARHCGQFTRVESLSLHREGGEATSLPAPLRGANRWLGKTLATLGLPGPNLVVRLVR
jgi:SAM-dependent methyltransferase